MYACIQPRPNIAAKHIHLVSSSCIRAYTPIGYTYWIDIGVETCLRGQLTLLFVAYLLEESDYLNGKLADKISSQTGIGSIRACRVLCLTQLLKREYKHYKAKSISILF